MRNKFLAVFAFILSLAAMAAASTETVLWNFSDANGDGEFPWSNALISDSAGNLYGTTSSGGIGFAGMVFELSPDGNGSYSETILHDFGPPGSGDGSSPYGSLLRDAAGNLYGTTQGGGKNSTGTIYKLSPKSGGGWTEKILYTFSASGVTDGASPSAGLIFGKNRTLYGTTTYGGAYGLGTVFQISETNGVVSEKVIHSFGAAGDGEYVYDPVVMGPDGNLYGTTSVGNPGAGAVYKLALENGNWKETILYMFTGKNGDGSGMYYVGLIGDNAGNIYGTTAFGGVNGNGTVWELVYSSKTKTYTESILYSFSATGSDGQYPYGGLTMDSSGHLFGTTEDGGNINQGVMFELTKSGSTWTESVVHSFDGGSDGEEPSANLMLGSNGQFYGMARYGGTTNVGIVYSVAP
jgi:uncharacterized repeat protein (TIGR03803 family)